MLQLIFNDLCLKPLHGTEIAPGTDGLAGQSAPDHRGGRRGEPMLLPARGPHAPLMHRPHTRIMLHTLSTKHACCTWDISTAGIYITKCTNFQKVFARCLFSTKIIDSIIDNISINADIQHCLGKHPCKSRSVYLGIAQITVFMVHISATNHPGKS